MLEKSKDIQKKQTGEIENVEHTRAARIYRPDVDIIEKNDSILLIADMPGVDEKTLDVTLEKDVLTIYGRVDIDKPENLELIHGEYGTGDYQRTFIISNEINRDGIKATVKNGVLQLLLPKGEVAKTKKIPVQAEK
ncbi:MAG TPA: heat-shock protein Hsp20 [Deltaproteobacteria bacterium]|nr:heat-shock protein Hsp20 [Deltaproteobacteria bacterium]